ncbi:MAG TPA: DUF5652 family protein [Candidatus Saccharimonadales bacterium]|nr:DUF5652 family protein [Candidatus Saccharimonadales bacterium]
MNPIAQFSQMIGKSTSPITQAIFVLISAWALAWKGFALYQAAKREQKMWFIALLVVNTAGILEIFYLFFVAKVKVDIKKLFNSITLGQNTRKTQATVTKKQNPKKNNKHQIDSSSIKVG